MVLGMSVIALSQARDNDRRGWDDGRRGGWNNRHSGWGYHHRSGPVMVVEQVSITGNLTIDKGSIAIKQGDTVYIVPGLQRFVGFIDSLKEGAQASVEGFAVPSRWDPQTKYVRVTRLNIGGQDYDMDASPSFPPR
jgi:hypothetical protein